MSDLSLGANTGAGNFATARRGGLDDHERRLIAEKAAKGVPLSAIAKMIARPVEEVRLVVGNVAPRETFTPPLPVWHRKGRGLKAMPRAAQLVVMDVAERNALTVEMLLSDRRYRAITHPRQECYALLYATGRYSLPLIASWFGVDHTTVLHGRKAFSKRLENPKPDDPENESMREYWRWLKQRQKAAA